MDAATRYALATRYAHAQGKTLQVPFPSDAYLSPTFEAKVRAAGADATFTYDADGQCVAFIRPEAREALDTLIAAF